MQACIDPEVPGKWPMCGCRQRHISGSPPSVYLFIYLFNRFHHDYNAKIRQKKTFEQGTKTRDERAGHTMERGPKLSVPLRKIHTEILTMLTM